MVQGKAKNKGGGGAVVIGVGAESGLGAALARRFAKEGLRVTIVGRTPERLQAVAEQIDAPGGAVAIKVAGATCEANMAALFDEADRDGDLEFVAYNVGNNIATSTFETTPELFERLWRQNTFGGFVIGREAARRFSERGTGTILFTGATASLRARPPFLAFAAGKSAQRAVAQGLAREIRPEGHPCRSHRHRRCDRGRICGDEFHRIGRFERCRWRPCRRRHRLLGAAPPETQRLDPRNRS